MQHKTITNEGTMELVVKKIKIKDSYDPRLKYKQIRKQDPNRHRQICLIYSYLYDIIIYSDI